MNEFIDYVIYFSAGWTFIWVFPFMFFLYRYGMGSDRIKYVDELIGNLSSDPEGFKIKHYYCLWPSMTQYAPPPHETQY